VKEMVRRMEHTYTDVGGLSVTATPHSQLQ
jgi:hypothetical protein